MDPEEYRKEIEEKILKIIEEKLIAGQMKAERAREISRYILHMMHPPLSLDEIYIKVQDFDKHFPEMVPAMLPLINDYEEKVKKVVMEHVSKLLQQDKIEEADSLLKRALNKQVKIGE